jgi:hypothetical protein
VSPDSIRVGLVLGQRAARWHLGCIQAHRKNVVNGSVGVCEVLLFIGSAAKAAARCGDIAPDGISDTKRIESAHGRVRMKTKTSRARTLGAVAGAMTLLAAPLMTSASEGGRVSFVGAIVAPQLQITEGSAADGARGGVAGVQTAQAGSALTLTFKAPPGVTGGADVALQVNDGVPARDLVAARFVDSGGRIAPARNGHYQVGRDGGVLSLSPKDARTDTRVTVVVSYQ